MFLNESKWVLVKVSSSKNDDMKRFSKNSELGPVLIPVWINLDSVSCIVKDNGRATFIMNNGAEIKSEVGWNFIMNSGYSDLSAYEIRDGCQDG